MTDLVETLLNPQRRHFELVAAISRASADLILGFTFAYPALLAASAPLPLAMYSLINLVCLTLRRALACRWRVLRDVALGLRLWLLHGYAALCAVIDMLQHASRLQPSWARGTPRLCRRSSGVAVVATQWYTCRSLGKAIPDQDPPCRAIAGVL